MVTLAHRHASAETRRVVGGVVGRAGVVPGVAHPPLDGGAIVISEGGLKKLWKKIVSVIRGKGKGPDDDDRESDVDEAQSQDPDEWSGLVVVPLPYADPGLDTEGVDGGAGDDVVVLDACEEGTYADGAECYDDGMAGKICPDPPCQ